MAGSVSRTVKAKFDGDAKGVEKAATQGVAASKRFEKGLAKLGETGAKIGSRIDQGMAGARRGLGKMGELGKKAGGGLASGLKLGLIGLGAIGLAAGVLVLGGIQKAMQDNAAKVQLAASLGLEGDQAKRIGKLAGQLYVQGYGESIADAGNTIKAAFDNGLVSINSSNEAIRQVAGEAKTFSTITGVDVVESTKAAAQAIKTGLAKNATEAYDLMTTATQRGLDKAGDLQDTLNEYGTQFRKLGLTGPKALGLISQGLKGGARDADIVADAIKEFSIRAVDGSKTTKDGFDSLGLSASKMTKDLAAGGPKASAALDTVLDKLRGIKDPAERSRIAVELFGTQAEDLGGALYKLDLSTADKEMAGFAGSTKRANDALSATPLARLETTKRLIQQTFVDLIGKLVLPYLEKFGAWFNGPGKYVMVDWALSGASAVLNFADTMFAQLQAVLGFMGKWGKALLYSMAAVVAVFNRPLAKSLKDAGDNVGGFAKRTSEELGKARDGITKTQDLIAKAKLVAKLTANKEDLDTKIAAAETELKNPALTATKKAKLTADIAELKTKRLEAQNEINKLQGKTVTITANVKLNSANISQKVNQQLERAGFQPGRASGGRLQPRKRYTVGENGRETLELDGQGGIITPHGVTPENSGGGTQVLEVHVEVGGEVTRVIRQEIRFDKQQTRRVVKARGR